MVGDGGFGMTGQEIATAFAHGGKPIIMLFNNNMYGTIRAHQEGKHPERVSGTNLVNPDFVAIAKAHGGHGELVRSTEDFMPAFDRSAKSGKPSIIEIVVEKEVISTRITLTGIREAAIKRQATTS